MIGAWRSHNAFFLGLYLVVACCSSSSAQPAASNKPEDPAIDKPSQARPQTFEELVRDPQYKNAKLLIPAGAPLVDIAKWEEHKRAFHLKSLKRSRQDFPDLRREVQTLTSAGPLLGNESSFEKVGSLTIFRFTNFDSFIKDTPSAKAKAIALGKAMFWDVRFSSDQKVACASCHYAAGADHRTSGTVSLPVNFGVHFPWPDPLSTTEKYLPYSLSSKDLVNGSEELTNGFSRGVFDPQSLVNFTTREVIGSQGIQHKQFIGIENGREISEAIEQEPMEGVSGKLMSRIAAIEGSFRQVTQRNAGTVINAVFNSRNFHDSRASFIFNGRSGWGRHSDERVNAALFVLRNDNGNLVKTTTWNRFINDDVTMPNPFFIANAALASQAVEPIVSDVEMSYSGRMLHHVADRMLDQKILDGQRISASDSSLGEFSSDRPTYRQLIKDVFRDQWWEGNNVKLPASGKDDDTTLREYDLMEANFSLFWGLAIQTYESTLISDDTPFDREQRAAKTWARAFNNEQTSASSFLTDSQRRGLDVFRSVGCAECHVGAEFTGASFAEIGLLKTSIDDQEPTVLGDEEDIVAGQVKCPVNKPLGVECMNQNGRMHSVYDGGNYVLGVSRFERAPSFPDSPALRGIDGLEGSGLVPYLFESDSQATLEDNGNGSPFLPPEYQPASDTPFTAADWQRGKLKAYLEKDDRFAELLKRLGASAVELAETQAAAVIQAAQEQNDTIDDEKGIKNAPVEFDETWSNLARPLNNTQQRKTQQPLKRKALRDLSKTRLSTEVKSDEPTALVEAPPLEDSLKLAEIEVDGVMHKMVVPSTEPPRVSLARRFLPDWIDSLTPEQVNALKDVLPERIADAGAFKAPTLRNVELTGPYMHNGSLLTLEAVVEFYSRGGDYNARVKKNEDDVKTGDKHPAMEPLNLSSEQKADLVDFLRSLTDDRVRLSVGPFDHPELPLVVGYKVGTNGEPVADADGTIEYRIDILPPTPDATTGNARVSSFEHKLLRGLDH